MSDASYCGVLLRIYIFHDDIYRELLGRNWSYHDDICGEFAGGSFAYHTHSHKNIFLILFWVERNPIFLSIRCPVLRGVVEKKLIMMIYVTIFWEKKHIMMKYVRNCWQKKDHIMMTFVKNLLGKAYWVAWYCSELLWKGYQDHIREKLFEKIMWWWHLWKIVWKSLIIFLVLCKIIIVKKM